MMSVPLLLIFSWPYYFFCHELGINRIATLAGSITFALPFMFTILHGHVTMALGAVHRHHYYNWLQGFPFTYGLLFHPIIISTRFRLILFGVSFLNLAIGYAWVYV